MTSPANHHIQSNIDDVIFQDLFDRVEYSTDSFLVTGKAGTGKSTFLRYLLSRTGKNMAVVAPTGLAAVQIGGQTIHSFFRFSPYRIDFSKIVRVPGKLFQTLDTIIIDEASMVRADLLDAIDHFLRLNGRSPRLPFGGIQMVLIGDVFQLPPVVTSEESAWFFEQYQSPYFFHSNVWRQVGLECVELEKVFRQSDEGFIEILQQIRTDTLVSDSLNQLNSRFLPAFFPKSDDLFITLTTTNKQAGLVNQSRLSALHTESKYYTGLITGNFPPTSLPVEQNLELKVGAQVLFVKNDSQKRWVNGTLGEVVELLEESVQIKIGEKIVEVVPETWEMLKYVFDPFEGKVQSEVAGQYSQLPIRLAWAITIHKSQGQTFDQAILDLSGGTFVHGQLYVALSRVRSLETLILKQKILPSHIKLDPVVVEFYKTTVQSTVRIF